MAQSTLLRACIDAARKWDRWQLTRILAPANQSAHAWLPAKMGALCLPTAAVATASATPYSSAVCCPWEAISDLPYQANTHTMPLRVTKKKNIVVAIVVVWVASSHALLLTPRHVRASTFCSLRIEKKIEFCRISSNIKVVENAFRISFFFKSQFSPRCVFSGNRGTMRGVYHIYIHKTPTRQPAIQPTIQSVNHPSNQPTS